MNMEASGGNQKNVDIAVKNLEKMLNLRHTTRKKNGMIIEKKILEFVGYYESDKGITLDISWYRGKGFIADWGQQKARFNLDQVRNTIKIGNYKKVTEGEMERT